MTIVQKDGYVFEVDIEKTIDYYKSHSLCGCDCCENFYAQINGKFPKLESFLSRLGVDISKPDEAMSVELDHTIQYISVDYTVCGKIILMGQYEIDIQDNPFISLVIIDGFASPNEQTSEYFTISLNNIELPWVLDKPFPKPIQTKINEKTNSLGSIFKRKKRATTSPKECLANIKGKIAQKTGISRYVYLGETSAAFSGTVDHFDLYISLGVRKRRGRDYLYAYMEDHFEWYEWDYASQSEFEDRIVEHFCTYINRTVKTITETKKHRYIRVTEYYLNKETNEWVLMSDDKVSWLMMRPFIEEDSVTEEIKEYHI
jgi:hypothetical protein